MVKTTEPKKQLTIISRLRELQEQLSKGNRSSKPLARLKQSMAQNEFNGLVEQLPLSTRRGFLRGNL